MTVNADLSTIQLCLANTCNVWRVYGKLCLTLVRLRWLTCNIKMDAAALHLADACPLFPCTGMVLVTLPSSRSASWSGWKLALEKQKIVFQLGQWADPADDWISMSTSFPASGLSETVLWDVAVAMQKVKYECAQQIFEAKPKTMLYWQERPSR